MDLFKELGLTKYESLVYSVLIKYGKNKARKISEYSKVPITAVYPSLKILSTKNLIQEIKGESSVFEVLPPKTAIDLFIEKKRNKLLKLKEDSIKYAKHLINEKKPTEKREIILLTHGKPFSLEVYYDSFKKAEKTYYIIGWKFDDINDKYNLLKEFKKMVKRKVDVKIILTGSLEKNWRLIKDYREEGINIKYLPLNDFSIFIMDSKECKITLKNQKFYDRINIQILDEDLSKAMNFYFLESWKKARYLKYDKKLKKVVIFED